MTTDNRTNEPNKYAGFIARQEHQRDPWRGIGKKCLCGVAFDSDVDHAMHQVEAILEAALVAAQGAAPAPSSTVDEDAAIQLVQDLAREAYEAYGDSSDDAYGAWSWLTERHEQMRAGRVLAGKEKNDE